MFHAQDDIGFDAFLQHVLSWRNYGNRNKQVNSKFNINSSFYRS